MRSALSFLIALGVWVFLSTEAVAEQPKRPAVNVPALIDKLVEVADSDTGYSATVTGSSFLPLDRQGHIGMGMLFQKPSVPSETMREIVKQGAAAVPHLIKHLGDKRKTKIIVQRGGILGGTFYGDEYDLNARTTKPPPAPAGQEDEDEEDGLDQFLGPSAKEPHTITVGDLCFVALGQIVNRHLNAVRYQPSAIIILSSPTQSPALLATIKNEWGKLTPERHRASLIADFRKPDFEGRRNEACRRLAYYYPDSLEPLVVPFLAQPTYDVFDVKSFVRNTLYKAKDAGKRRELFEAYLAKKRQPSREGILEQLFRDLDTLEYGTQPRELLIELYGYKKDVKSSQGPHYLDAISATEKAQFISEGLIYDRRVKIDGAVRHLLASIEQDDSLALACMKRLVGRGYDADIEKYCRRRIPRVEGDERKELQEMLDRLGWNLVHVAVERHDEDGLRALIAEGANVQAKARNGMMPLHLAAAAGDGTSLRLLLDAKAALDPKNARGETPVQLASRAGHDEIVQFLVRKGCAVSDILTAAIVGQRERVAALLSQGHIDAARLLLERGMDVNARGSGLNTPLYVAASNGQVNMIRFLLKNKADIQAADDDNFGPLFAALATGHLEAARVLLDHNADVNAREKVYGCTPLHYAAGSGEPALVSLLLDRKAAVDATDKQGETPLHRAALYGDIQAARVLLDRKANCTIKDKNGLTPLALAIKKKHSAIVQLLRKHGAKN